MSHIDTSAYLNRWRKKSLAEKSLLAFGMLLIAVSVSSWQAALLVAALMIGATLFGAGVAFPLWWKTMTPPIGFLIAGVFPFIFQVQLWHIGVPAEIAEMMLLMYRFIFLLTDTAETMNAAQAARLGHITYRGHMKSLSLLIANLMPRAFARAHALEIGLAARGWRGELRVLRPVRRASATGLSIILALEVLVLLFGLYTS
jgi:cobalt/nickel transport system permease protein